MFNPFNGNSGGVPTAQTADKEPCLVCDEHVDTDGESYVHYTETVWSTSIPIGGPQRFTFKIDKHLGYAHADCVMDTWNPDTAAFEYEPGEDGEGGSDE